MPEKANNGEASDAPEKSRLERLKDERGEQYQPAMPPLEGGEHVLEHFWAVGPTTGDGPLTHGELRAYQHNTGVELSVWEVVTLRAMSASHLVQARRAVKRDCPAPWQESVDAVNLVAVDVRDSIRALAKM